MWIEENDLECDEGEVEKEIEENRLDLTSYMLANDITGLF